MKYRFLLLKTLTITILFFCFSQNLNVRIKSANKKKHDAFLKNLITDLKSARKNTIKKVLKVSIKKI